MKCGLLQLHSNLFIKSFIFSVTILNHYIKYATVFHNKTSPKKPIKQYIDLVVYERLKIKSKI